MAISEPVPFAHLLSRYRLAVGLTQEELAERAGVSARGVSDLERGVITKPRAYTVYQLAEALQLSPRDRALFEAAAYQWTVLPGDRPRGEHALPMGSFLGALPPGRFVAREEEMERIRQLLEAAGGGTGQLLLLAGERGVGKTRLAQEVMVAAQQRGFLVLTGRSQGASEEDPLAPIWQALSVLERDDSWVGNSELVRRWQGILKLAKTRDWPRLFPAIGELITLQAAISPLALLLDDVQRAAPATVQLVDHLARSTRNAPVFLLAVYREAQLADENPALAQAVQDLARERLAERITLRRFIPEETAALAAALMGQEPVSEDFADFLYRRSKGNPRYVEELIRSLGGRLELEGEIGAGAMGRVFAAYDRKTDQEVAAKLMLARDEVGVETLHRFQQEGATLASLNHPNIVRIYDTFIEEHASCIVMERVEGRSLRQVLEDGPLSMPRARRIAQQVASALDHAQQAQIVHRDVKPDNIMVTADDQVKVTDFGIARLLRPDVVLETMATTGMRMGTPLYMAPEQIQGKRVDGRADIYGLGAVLFHMVTGRPPFEGSDALAIAIQHLQEEPPRPSSINPEVPADWDAVILKAIAKEPARRFQSAREMEQAIRDLDERVSTGVEPPTRRRWPVSLLGGVLAVALIGVIVAPAVHQTTSARPLTTVGRRISQWGYAGLVSPSLRAPSGIAVSAQGDVYVADTNHDRIVELSPSGLPIGQWGSPGNGVGQLTRPEGVAVDRQGDVYVADTDNYRIQEFSPNGTWLGQWPLSAPASPYLNPENLAADRSGALYITAVPDPHLASNLIKLLPSGRSQVVGVPARLQTCSFPCGDRPLGDPVGVAVDGQGAVYLPDSAGTSIRKLSPAGKVLSTWRSHFNHPSGIALDPEGHIYVADTGNSRIVKLSAGGRLLASWRTAGPSSTPFRHPEALAVDARGNVYVADTGNNRILQLSPGGVASGQWNPQPPPPIVRLRALAMTVDTHDNVWAVSSDAGRLYELSPAGKPLLDRELPGRLGLRAASGIAVDGTGRVSILASLGGGVSGVPVIVQFSSSGAFLSEWGYFGGGTGGLSSPSGLAVDQPGNLYVADTGNFRIQKFSPTGQPLRQWGAAGEFEWPVGVALDQHGNVWVVDSASDQVQELSPAGRRLALWGKTGSRPGEFRGPTGIATDAQGNIYVADTENNRIQKLSPDGHPLAQSGTIGFDPGAFLAPTQVSVDSHGDVYVLDWRGIHKLQPSR